MPRVLALLAVVAWGLLAPDSWARAAEKPPPFSIDFAYAGLTEIAVKEGKLRYVWHTPRQRDGVPAADRASLANYDRHQIDVWLTDKEAARFRDWIARHKVFEFDNAYSSPPGGNSRGGAFQSGLTVVLGDKKHGVTWAGDSKEPKKLAVAVNELTSLCGEIQKSRNK